MPHMVSFRLSSRINRAHLMGCSLRVISLTGYDLERGAGDEDLASIQDKLFTWYAPHSLKVQAEYLANSISSMQPEYHEHCMKILIYSRVFWPSVGGLETMMEILAEEFTAAGHQVKVATQVAVEEEGNQDYEVVRLPTPKSFMKLLRWSDVCLSAGVSLRGLLPMMIARTPLVVSHQGTYDTANLSIVAELKKAVTRFSKNICCSQAVQSHIPGRSVVIPNSYRAEIFKEYRDVIKDLDIVVVGRLVSDKGVSDLIEAMGELGRAGFRPRLSIVGDGPERPAILTRVEGLGLGPQVTFTGVKRGSELARFVARHRVMAVPSRWAEPFGIVALEGIACGCAIVGTALGGLPEAIGPCGVTVPNGDTYAMARALRSLLEDDSLRARYTCCAPVHLARHSRLNVARSYLNVLESAASLSSRATACRPTEFTQMNKAIFLVDRVLRRILPLAGAHRILLRWRAWQAARFGEPEIRLLRYLVDPKRTAIDIGAAEGTYAFFLQRLAQRCIAFEPNPSSHLGLKRALPEIEIHQAAVSAVEGNAILRVPVVNGIPYSGWGTIEPKNQLTELPPHTVEERRVRTVRPDRMALGDIGFVKIDVEGHELDVLAGLSALLAKCLPNLLIEIGNADRGGSLAEVRRRLDALGYVGLRIDDRGLLKVLANKTELKGSSNVIFIPMNGPLSDQAMSDGTI